MNGNDLIEHTERCDKCKGLDIEKQLDCYDNSFNEDFFDEDSLKC